MFLRKTMNHRRTCFPVKIIDFSVRVGQIKATLRKQKQSDFLRPLLHEGRTHRAFFLALGGSHQMDYSRDLRHQRHGCDCCEQEVFHMPEAFNSSLVLPSCLRRRSVISLCFPSSAQLSGVSPSTSFAFRSAPLAISSSTISL